MTAKMESLLAEKNKYITANKALNPIEDLEKFTANNEAIEKINKAIVALEVQEQNEKSEVLEQTNTNTVTEKPKFNSFAEQLIAIKNAAISKGRDIDKRLIKDEIKGVSTTVEADGGYAIQSDFLGNILESAFQKSEIIRRCKQYTVTRDSNGVNYVLLDDASDAENVSGVVVAGGVQAFWTSEGQTVTPTKPKIKAAELKLAKIMGLCYATEESLQDIPFMAQLIEDSFSDAVAGLLTDGILNGKGNNDTHRQPIGLLSSGSNAVIDVEPTGTALSARDLLAMKSAIRTKNWANAVWFMHPDNAADLPLLNDGSTNLLYMPEGGLSGSQYGTLFGRPIIFDEFLPAKGERGSILLADFSEYMLIKKGDERKDWSMHVEFLTDQWCYRIIMRVNGAPIKNNVWSVRNSTKKQSAFVVLGKVGE